MMNEQNDDNVYGYYTGSDLINSDLSLLERTLMGAIRSLCDGYSKAKPGSTKYGGVWYELDTECAKRINVPVVSVRRARRELQAKGWLNGDKMWHGRCNVKMSPKWYAERDIAEGANMDWTGKGDQIEHTPKAEAGVIKLISHSDHPEQSSDQGDHYNQSIERLVEDKSTESVALGAPSSFERADSQSSTTSSDLVAEAHTRAEADFPARQQADAGSINLRHAEAQAKLNMPTSFPLATPNQDKLDREEALANAAHLDAVNRINRRHAESQAKLNMPTSFPLEPAPLPEALPFDPSTVPLEQPTPVYPVPPETTESVRAALDLVKSTIITLRGPDYRPSPITFGLAATKARIKALAEAQTAKLTVKAPAEEDDDDDLPFVRYDENGEPLEAAQEAAGS